MSLARTQLAATSFDIGVDAGVDSGLDPSGGTRSAESAPMTGSAEPGGPGVPQFEAAPLAGEGAVPRVGPSQSAPDGEGAPEEEMDERARRKAEAAVDHALIRQALQGDEEGFAGLVERHQRRAFRVARNLVPTDEDAQDLAQEAFLRVFKSLDRFDFGHEFTTWLYRIVTNLCIDFLRKRRAAVSVSTGRGDIEEGAALELEDPRQAAPSDHAEALETASEVEAVLATLAPHFQSVLTLREIEGLSCPEIAEIVGATHVTVRWRLHRGRKLFQEEWERRGRMRSQGGTEMLHSQAATADAEDGTEDKNQPTRGSSARTPHQDGSRRSGDQA